MLSDLEKEDRIKKLFSNAEFVEKLIKLSSKEDIKRELGKELDISDEKEIDTLSHEVFEIISKLKKMSESELLEISGGARGGEQDIVDEVAEVAELGMDVGNNLAVGNVPGALWQLGKDAAWQGMRFVGSLWNLKNAEERYQAADKAAKESMRQTDELNNSKKQLVNIKHGAALVALAVVGSAAVYKMFKKKKK